MNKMGLILLVVVWSFSVLAQNKGVYGDDNRYESHERSASYTLAQSVGAQIHSGFFKFERGGKVVVEELTSLKEEYNLCQGTRFADQPVLASCSGALVADDLIMTAGHCYQERNDCKDFYWVFGYEMGKNGKLKEFEAQNIYSCVKVERKVYNGYGDYALIRLDRPVRGRTPIKVADSGYRSKNGDEVFMIGYPSGLPMKTTESGKVMGFEKNSFLTNLDAFAANSGSPVFNAKTQEIVGILIAGDEDYSPSRNQCSIISKYSETEGNEEVQSVHIVPRIF